MIKETLQRKIKEINEKIAFIELNNDIFKPGTTEVILKQYRNSLDKMIEEFDKINKKYDYMG